jgi:hypothetical protein
MKDAADTVGTDPDDLSFIGSYRAIRRQVTNQAGFSPERRLPLNQLIGKVRVPREFEGVLSIRLEAMFAPEVGHKHM